MGRKLKFQVQDSDLEYLFWRFDKYIALSEKKLPLPQPYNHEIVLCSSTVLAWIAGVTNNNP